VKLFSGRQNDAVNALIKLQFCGVTEDEILRVHKFLNAARLESARGTGTRNFGSYLFDSRNGSYFSAPK
jgi:hypothetical protein